MIWRLLTCFSLAAGSLIAASVSGQVQIRDSKVDAVLKRRDFSGIVVSLRPVNAPVTPAPATHAVITQKDKTFAPHLLPIVTGTIVDFPNVDPIFHNAFSSYNG